MNDNNQTVIVRHIGNIGIDAKLNGWNIDTETLLEKKFYNGRICFQVAGKRIGLTALRKKKPCKIIIEHNYPF